MLDHEQIFAPQFEDAPQEPVHSEQTTFSYHPLALTMAPLLFGAGMMTAMREARDSSSILRGISRRRATRP